MPTSAVVVNEYDHSRTGRREFGPVYGASNAGLSATDSTRVQIGTVDGAPVNAAVLSNVAPTYAPAGRHLVVVALPGVVDDVERRARRVVEAWWGEEAAGAWPLVRTYAIVHGQPDQSPPFDPKEPVALGDGLSVCGDHRDTASIQGALFSGRRAATAALALLA